MAGVVVVAAALVVVVNFISFMDNVNVCVDISNGFGTIPCFVSHSIISGYISHKT